MHFQKEIIIQKEGYNPFLDYLKAYSIFFVVFAHCLPAVLYNLLLFRVWGDMQVPMFILIQTFHAYKKEKCPLINWGKMIKRIIIPFVTIQLFIFFFASRSTIGLISFLKGGGGGPGSYYFWVYIQFAVLLPCLWRFVSTASKNVLLSSFFAISIGAEVLFSIINLPDFVYRLLATRYLFLIFLAYEIWIKEGVKINKKIMILSIFSIMAVLFFSFSQSDLEPIFYNTGWKTHRWICYYYVATLLVYALWFIYKKVEKFSWLDKSIKLMGRCSYEIYLMQMVVFVFLSGRLSFINSLYTYIKIPLYMLMMITISIMLGIGFKILIINNCKFLQTK